MQQHTAKPTPEAKPVTGTVEAKVRHQSHHLHGHFLHYRTDKNSKYHKLKQSIHTLLYPHDNSNLWSSLVNIFIASLVLITVLAVILETEKSIFNQYHDWFIRIEVFAIGVFTIEYFLRIWSCTALEKYKHPVKGRLKYIFSFGSIIDLLAILPFYLPLIIGFDIRFIMTLRLFRFLRLLKLTRYMHASRILTNVIVKKKEELILSMSITFLLIIFSSSLMFFIEHNAQPDKFSSIPHTMWWAVSTLTTVGYGDIYPVTPIGKMLTGIISILGVGLFALPTGILVSGFSTEFNNQASEIKTCPHCGKNL